GSGLWTSAHLRRRRNAVPSPKSQVSGGTGRLSAMRKTLCVGITLGLFALTLRAADKPRARDLGVPFEGTPGPLNAITDVKGVEVGQSTIIRGDGKLEVGKGPVRTGVTAVVPRGKDTGSDPVF